MGKTFSNFNDSSIPSIPVTPSFLYAVAWEESERGWGTRPDGYSFHRTVQEAQAFIKKQQDSLPDDYVPDEYSRPRSDPKPLEVSKGLYDYVMKKGDLWLSHNSSETYKTLDTSTFKS